MGGAAKKPWTAISAGKSGTARGSSLSSRACAIAYCPGAGTMLSGHSIQAKKRPFCSRISVTCACWMRMSRCYHVFRLLATWLQNQASQENQDIIEAVYRTPKRGENFMNIAEFFQGFAGLVWVVAAGLIVLAI